MRTRRVSLHRYAERGNSTHTANISDGSISKRENESMRAGLLFAVALLLSACQTERAVTPREYLDEQSAATITVVKDPWIFTRGAGRAGSEQHRDFLHLYAIDVNRMGDHKQYIAAMHSLADESSEHSGVPTLELKSRNGSISLQATTAESKDLGIVQPIAPSYALDTSWWYFPVDKQTLATIANTREVEASIVWRGERTDFALWRDGREELSELTAVLP